MDDARKQQEAARQRWIAAAQAFVEELDAIDKATPAMEYSPEWEPGWWIHMSGIRRDVCSAIAFEEKGNA